MTEMLTCPACGEQMEADARFCESCGLAFRAVEPAEAVDPVEPDSGAPAEGDAAEAEAEIDERSAVTTPVTRVAPAEPVASAEPVAPVEPSAQAPATSPQPTPAPAPPPSSSALWGTSTDPDGWVASLDPFAPLLPPEDADDAFLAPAVLVTDFEPEVGTEISDVPAPQAAPAPVALPAYVPVAGAGYGEAPTAPIGAERLCARCGGTIARDGYCELCGEPAASERDHYRESPAAWVGGACDRGVVHSRNEDAMALGVLEADGDVAVLVVCDGVSSAPDSDVASLAASRAAATTILDGIRNADGPSAEQIRDLSLLLGRSAVAANEAVVATTRAGLTDEDNPPSCTFVAAAVDGPLVVTAWLGDSRAYWLPDAGPARQLSVDHSWAQEAIEQGMPRVEAERARHAHAITRWLGTDAPDLAVRTDAMVAREPGWVLVCSDGLWNYCSPAADLAALVATTSQAVGSDPTMLAAELVTWANAQGGRDNITVALARIEAPRL